MYDATEVKNYFQAQFRLFESGLNGQKKAPLHALRTAAMERFAGMEFPTARHEEWKYTNLETLFRQKFELPVASATVNADALNRVRMVDAHRLVFVNGIFNSDLSITGQLPNSVFIGQLKDGVQNAYNHIEPLLQVSLKDNVFSHLNLALSPDGAYVRIPSGLVIEKPIHAIYLTTGERPWMTFPSNIFIIGNNVQCTIVEDYLSREESVHFTNAVSNFSVGENSVVRHAKIQDESRSAFHVSTMTLTLERSANWHSTQAQLGSALSRNLTVAHLNGEGIEATLNGLYMPQDAQHTDNRTIIHHAKPFCNSHELYKGIMDGKSTAVFNGKIFVHPHAIKTDAKQSNNNLLLSPDAIVNTKPQLEIFADDVKCTHGATVGRLEEKGMFYLRSRGIGYEEAKGIMTLAFAEDIVTRIPVESVRQRLDRMLHQKLGIGIE